MNKILRKIKEINLVLVIVDIFLVLFFFGVIERLKQSAPEGWYPGDNGLGSFIAAVILVAMIHFLIKYITHEDRGWKIRLRRRKWFTDQIILKDKEPRVDE